MRQTDYIYMMVKIVHFMTPRAEVLVLGRDHISHIVKMYYFFKNRLLYSQAKIRQTGYIVMMTNEFYLFYDGAVDMLI